jgi:hypothetical protein
MKKCINCNTTLIGKGATCDCEDPQLVTVTPKLPTYSLGPWLCPLLLLTMAVLLVTVIIRANVREQEKPLNANATRVEEAFNHDKPSGVGEIDTNPSPADTDIEADQDESEQSVHFDSMGEQTLLAMLGRLKEHLSAEHMADDALSAIVYRIGTLQEAITKDVKRGGPLASVEFRNRWGNLISNERARNRPLPPELDDTLTEDVVLRRPVARRRIIALGEAIDAMEKRLTSTFIEERKVGEFLQSLRPSVRQDLFVGDATVREATLKVQVDLDTIEEMFSHGRRKIRISKYDMDATDALLLVCLPQGIVKTAYKTRGLEATEAFNEFRVARHAIADFLAGRPLRVAVSEPSKTVAIPSQSAPESKEPSEKEGPDKSDKNASNATPPVGPIVTLPPPPKPEAKTGPKLPGILRQWTDIQGNSCYAKLVEVDGSRVTLEAPKGGRESFLVPNFSPKDQKYLQPFLSDRGGVVEVPKASPKPKRRNSNNRNQQTAIDILSRW